VSYGWQATRRFRPERAVAPSAKAGPGALYLTGGLRPARTPLHALSRAASSARSVRVAHSLRSFALAEKKRRCL